MFPPPSRAHRRGRLDAGDGGVQLQQQQPVRQGGKLHAGKQENFIWQSVYDLDFFFAFSKAGLERDHQGRPRGGHEPSVQLGPDLYGRQVSFMNTCSFHLSVSLFAPTHCQ